MSAEQPQPPLKDDVITAVQLTLAVLFVLGGLGIAHIIIRSYYEKGPVVYPLEGALVLAAGVVVIYLLAYLYE
ncbi:hypothetical protein [Natrinema soli]|uniref:Uncharacterized protein n=1 Tax=Natrinema soli TaxID=1930624 RepID=A0ABD5SNL9_9EURY|nr:hypothetical protein [Natrinema soli]